MIAGSCSPNVIVSKFAAGFQAIYDTDGRMSCTENDLFKLDFSNYSCDDMSRFISVESTDHCVRKMILGKAAG
jgi:hypothetical protein